MIHLPQKINKNIMDYAALKNIIPYKTDLWTLSDVQRWLRFVHLGQLAPYFNRQSIDGSCIGDLTQEDLNELGVDSRIIKKKLIKWIQVGFREFNQYLLQERQQNQQDEHSSHTSISEASLMIQTQPYTDQNQLLIRQKTQKMNKYRQKSVTLIIQKIQSTEKSLYKFKEQSCRIGHHHTCDILVEDERVEVFHSEIIYTEPNYILRNTAKYDSTYIKVNKQIKLKEKTTLEMGNHVFRISIDFQGDLVSISIIEGENTGEKFEFRNEDKITIGRRVGHHISFNTDNTLSNYHAKMTKIQKKWYLEDMGTTNGTWIDLQSETIIRSGLIFKLGGSASTYQCRLQNQKQEKNLLNKNQNRQEIMDQHLEISCLHCRQSERNVIFLPCKHCAVCEKCSRMFKICLICDQEIVGVTKIYRG